MSSHQDGFEYKLPGDDEATFFPWAVSDGGKDMLLIDRFTGMPLHEFFDVIGDSFDLSRGPIMLAMVATSIRARFPEWTPERITRMVQNLSLSQVEFIEAEEEAQSLPPDGEAEQQTPGGSGSPSEGSKRSATPPAASTSETSAVIPA